MGSKGSQTTQTQNQTYTADPAIRGAGYQALGAAQSAASQPFQMPVAPVAGFTPLQQQAFNQYQALQGSAQPYYNQAQGLYTQASQPVSAQQVSNFYNPMAANVTAQLENIFGQQNQQNNASLINAAGGVGADRIAVGQGNLANQQGLAAGQTYANLYQQALQAAQQQQQTEMGAASGLTGLGGQVLGSNLQGTGALLGAGTQQQQQAQAELNAPYQQRLAQLAYPFQTAQYLAGITGGLAPALGGTTIGAGTQVTTPPQPSLLSQILGIGTAGAGIYGSLGGFGGSPAYGGGSAFSGDAFGGTSANPLPGLSPLDYGAGFADGGDVPDQPELHENSIVPTVPLMPGAGHSGPLTGGLNMQFSQPQQQSNSGDSTLGDIGKIASTVLPFLLKKGGPVPGYDDGGGADDNDIIHQLGTTGTATAPVGAAPDPVYDLLLRNRVQSASASPPAFGQQSAVPFPNATGQMPLPQPPPRPVTRKPASAGATGARQGTTSSVPVGDELPYPEALSRDWGQNAARSPWLALVNAGATMAATPGPLGVSIGKGLLAGTKTLGDERTALTSEEKLNQKAQELSETAKEHLKKWNSMTPYERASVAARNRELDQNEEGVTGKPGKFTGADYDRAAKFVQSMNPGLPPEQLQPLIEAEVSRRRRYLAGGTSAQGAVNSALPAQIPVGTTKQFDDGKGGTVTGVWDGTQWKPKQ